MADILRVEYEVPESPDEFFYVDLPPDTSWSEAVKSVVTLYPQVTSVTCRIAEEE